MKIFLTSRSIWTFWTSKIFNISLDELVDNKTSTTSSNNNKEIIIKILKNWNNVNNYIQNEDFNEEEYKHANFYKYLKDNLFKDTPKNFPNEYSFKKRFANYEYKNISQYEELTNEIKEVTEKLYDFIIKNNEIW